MATSSDILDLLKEQMAMGSRERRAQTEAFTSTMEKQSATFAHALSGLRMELRALSILAIVVIGGMSGLSIYVKTAGVEIGTGPDASAGTPDLGTHDAVPVDSDTDLGV